MGASETRRSSSSPLGMLGWWLRLVAAEEGVDVGDVDAGEGVEGDGVGWETGEEVAVVAGGGPDGGARHVSAEVIHRIHRIHRDGLEVLPRRWVVERTWSRLMSTAVFNSTTDAAPKSSKGPYGPPTPGSSSADLPHPPNAPHDISVALHKHTGQVLGSSLTGDGKGANLHDSKCRCR
jgi:hypothetical protein